ncbi:MAG: carboxymuconolactone decarboxylase family protein [Myxococcota bacterium]
MTTSRVPLLSSEEAKRAAAEVELFELKANFSIYRVLLRQPLVAKRLSDLTDVLVGASHIDARLRELLIMRLGWANRGVYEWSQHWKIALLHDGIEKSDLLAIRDWEVHDHWSPRDRAAFRATDETLEHGVLSKETWSEVAQHFPTHEERIELVTIISCWKMLSDIMKTLEVPLDEGVEPWLPDGLEPPGPQL